MPLQVVCLPRRRRKQVPQPTLWPCLIRPHQEENTSPSGPVLSGRAETIRQLAGVAPGNGPEERRAVTTYTVINARGRTVLPASDAATAALYRRIFDDKHGQGSPCVVAAGPKVRAPVRTPLPLVAL